jgi:hypothetical protein
MFADDTTIFEKSIFQEFIERYTKKEGSDLAGQLATLFDVHNKYPKDRLRNLDESFAQFACINGMLFDER